MIKKSKKSNVGVTILSILVALAVWGATAYFFIFFTSIGGESGWFQSLGRACMGGLLGGSVGV